MYKDKKTCQKPEKLTGKPQDCLPERIRKCHGEAEGHPCVKRAKKK